MDALRKAKMALMILSFFSLVAVRVDALDYPVEAIAANASPFIDADSFRLKIFSTEEPYASSVKSDSLTPHAFTGENLSFAVSVSDDNGDQDVLNAGAVLSDDTVIDESDIVVELNAVESTRDGDVWLNFTNEWTVPSSAYGLKKILITAEDSGGSEASNNGLLVGEVFLNPIVSYEVTSGGSLLASLNFTGAPGARDVHAEQNPISVANLDPDAVGTKIEVFAKGTDLANADGTAVIPVSNMKVNGIVLSTTPQLIFSVGSGASNTLEFTLDFPVPLPAGSYKGTTSIIIEVV